MVTLRPFLFSALVALAGSAALTDREIADAIALGRTCRAPIVHVEAPEYDLYVESPFAHAALIAAVAVVNHESLDAPGIRNAMVVPGYRIWAARRFGVEPVPSIAYIAVQPAGGPEIRAAEERRDRLFVGSLPSHGIIDSLRTRIPQFVFHSLPSGDYDVVVHTNNGVRRHRITSARRSILMNVCNKWM